MAPAPPTPLPYAPPPSRIGRRIRRAILVLLVIGLFAGGWRWRGAIAGQFELLYWQRRCMAYDRPPGAPVFEFPDGAKGVMPAGGDPDLATIADPATGRTTLRVRRPACLARFGAAAGPWPAGALPSWAGAAGTAFLHGLTSGGGRTRLVIVSADWVAPLNPAETLNWAVIEPATLLGGPRVLNERSPNGFVGPCGIDDLGYGQTDPADRSHFTIEVRGPGGARVGVIDGWLRDDDTLAFATRWEPGSWQAEELARAGRDASAARRAP